jgi:lysophospholipase L1-like esterase
MTGINNVAMEDLDFLHAYREIIKRLRSACPDAKIYINSLLPTLVDFIPDESIMKVNKSLEELARDTRTEYINIYRLFISTHGRPCKDYLLDDGVHLSERGYAIWSGDIERLIDKFC